MNTKVVENISYDLEGKILKHDITVSPYPSIVYAKINSTELGEKYADHGGDKRAALRRAVERVIAATSVTIYAPSEAEIIDLCKSTGRGADACRLALRKHQGDQKAAAGFLGRF